MTQNESAVYLVLETLNIPYERFEHQEARTMLDCEMIDENINAAHCKNLFLCNRQGTQPYLLLVVGDKAFRTKDVSAQLGVARLSFGTAAQLNAVLGLTPGSVSPMGLINDLHKRTHVLVDRELSEWEKIVVHPNVNTASIILSTADLKRFLEYCGNEITYVDI
ncbi:prolyl-tRNA synthetase associated domain-containing protein [Eubacteriales bacterium OttesenSCG-928-K08]|nr:prolyl-tRNA synthetase associated domain-containing protein [Eubacteriales bacterium OttesenSCG-928-K08]